jgi:choline kinase
LNYIVLAAGVGRRLHPLTLSCPKCLFNLSEDYSILQRMIDKIKKYDSEARIVTVIGFMNEMIKDKITGTEFVYNPFFEVTNSVASLWFVKDYLNDEVTIINGDIVMDSQLVQEVLVKSFEYPLVLLDSSVKSNGDYNVQVQDDNVLVMSKELNQYYGEYAGVSKIDKGTIQLFKAEIEKMISDGYYDQWYENVLVQLIFNSNLRLKYKDIKDYEWTEVDCVDDLLKAKSIQLKEN